MPKNPLDPHLYCFSEAQCRAIAEEFADEVNDYNQYQILLHERGRTGVVKPPLPNLNAIIEREIAK